MSFIDRGFDSYRELAFGRMVMGNDITLANGFVLLSIYLVANTQLFKRLCRSVGPLVHRSVGPSVPNEKMGVFDTFVYVCECNIMIT